MSADLFEAFVGTQNSSEEPPKRVSKRSPDWVIQPKSPTRPEDTWQSWPIAAGAASELPAKQQPQVLWETDDNGNNVLFDAGNFDAGPAPLIGDDEFGDFEDAVTKKSDDHTSKVASQLATTNLLDLEPDETESSSKEAGSFRQGIPATGGFSQIVSREEIATSADNQDDEWGDFETTEVSITPVVRPQQREPSQKNTAPMTLNTSNPVRGKPREQRTPPPRNSSAGLIKNESVEEEPWDDFDNDEPDRINTSNNLKQSPLQQSRFEPAMTTDVIQRDRPTNMPPPAVLLSWLPNVFSALAAQARQPNADVNAGTAAVQAYRVSARVIAGRAARWKRDNILAQSMKIGAAGRNGGMKLAALDKGESRKEDQAAEEVIASWTRFSHVLNAAIIRAKAQKPPMALSSKLSARLATGLDVVTATHICAVCGLRRNERVIGIDVSVSDTFGEFWIEHWGHKDCADTWYNFKGLLGQR